MKEIEYKLRYPLGHYYSPIPSCSHIEQFRKNIFTERSPQSLAGIDMNVNHQIDLLGQIRKHLVEMPIFSISRTPEFRFYHGNDFYAYIDATLYALMMLFLKPKRIVEVGSGHSTHMALDINERCLHNSVQITCYEPYPERLKTMLRPGDPVRLIEEQVEYTDLNEFKQLAAGDILFIDSSHVTRTGNDVNYLFFEVLPSLASGVYIHIHDIFYPFEYPEHWVDEGRAWSEVYLVRAFLQYNRSYSIEVFANYLLKYHSELFQNHPNWGPGNIGSRASLWLKKL